jgi:hypothetical protein
MLQIPSKKEHAEWFASLCKALHDVNRLEKITTSSQKIPGFSWPVEYDNHGNTADNSAQFEEVDMAELQNQSTQYDRQETDIDSALKIAGVRI